MNCGCIFVGSDSGLAMPYGKAAIATCGDCGTAICEDCCVECCEQSFCGACYD